MLRESDTAGIFDLNACSTTGDAVVRFAVCVEPVEAGFVAVVDRG
jgi:hypothetical protein